MNTKSERAAMITTEEHASLITTVAVALDCPVNKLTDLPIAQLVQLHDSVIIAASMTNNLMDIVDELGLPTNIQIRR